MSLTTCVNGIEHRRAMWLRCQCPHPENSDDARDWHLGYAVEARDERLSPTWKEYGVPEAGDGEWPKG